MMVRLPRFARGQLRGRPHLVAMMRAQAMARAATVVPCDTRGCGMPAVATLSGGAVCVRCLRAARSAAALGVAS